MGRKCKMMSMMRMIIIIAIIIQDWTSSTIGSQKLQPLLRIQVNLDNRVEVIQGNSIIGIGQLYWQQEGGRRMSDRNGLQKWPRKVALILTGRIAATPGRRGRTFWADYGLRRWPASCKPGPQVAADGANCPVIVPPRPSCSH